MRGKRVQKFGPHEHTVKVGTDWPLMAMYRQLQEITLIDPAVRRGRQVGLQNMERFVVERLIQPYIYEQSRS